MRTKNNKKIESINDFDALIGNVNVENIYRMLHEFRYWNKDWDTFMTNKPKDVDQFVAMLAKKYEVTPI